MIAKMRRQGQHPILFYVLLLAVGPRGMQKFCMYFLQVNFLWGCFITEMMGKGMRALCSTTGRALQEASDGYNRAVEGRIRQRARS